MKPIMMTLTDVDKVVYKLSQHSGKRGLKPLILRKHFYHEQS